MEKEMKVTQVQYRCRDRTYRRHVCEQGIRRGRLNAVQPGKNGFDAPWYGIRHCRRCLSILGLSLSAVLSSDISIVQLTVGVSPNAFSRISGRYIRGA